jgi:uncharacterized membrane protein
MPYQPMVKEAILHLSVVIEAAAALIIAVGAIEALIRAALFLYKRQEGKINRDTRLRLGRRLALALEFLLAADILRTAIAPTWNEIGQLAAIATIRTALNYFLEQEVEREEAAQGGLGKTRAEGASSS